jgi:hypothetical protein
VRYWDSTAFFSSSPARLSVLADKSRHAPSDQKTLQYREDASRVSATSTGAAFASSGVNSTVNSRTGALLLRIKVSLPEFSIDAVLGTSCANFSSRQ